MVLARCQFRRGEAGQCHQVGPVHPRAYLRGDGGPVFRYAFSANENAVFNAILRWAGLSAQNWRSQQHTTMIVFVIFCCWKWMGVNIIYYFPLCKTYPESCTNPAGLTAPAQSTVSISPSIGKAHHHLRADHQHLWRVFHVCRKLRCLTAPDPGDIGAHCELYFQPGL